MYQRWTQDTSCLEMSPGTYVIVSVLSLSPAYVSRLGSVSSLLCYLYITHLVILLQFLVSVSEGHLLVLKLLTYCRRSHRVSISWIHQSLRHTRSHSHLYQRHQNSLVSSVHKAILGTVCHGINIRAASCHFLRIVSSSAISTAELFVRARCTRFITESFYAMQLTVAKFNQNPSNFDSVCVGLWTDYELIECCCVCGL